MNYGPFRVTYKVLKQEMLNLQDSKDLLVYNYIYSKEVPVRRTETVFQVTEGRVAF